jgi:nucleotide-binding universal stress UspA family protein
MYHKILTIVSFLRISPKTILESLSLAKENQADWIVMFVLDSDYADKVATSLQDLGWIGNKPSEDFYESLLKEYRLQAETKLEEIARQAKAQGIPFRSIIRSGRLLPETLKVTHLEEPDLIVITRRKHSRLSRLIFGSLSKSLQKKVSCPVKVIDAE